MKVLHCLDSYSLNVTEETSGSCSYSQKSFPTSLKINFITVLAAVLGRSSNASLKLAKKHKGLSMAGKGRLLEKLSFADS